MGWIEWMSLMLGIIVSWKLENFYWDYIIDNTALFVI